MSRAGAPAGPVRGELAEALAAFDRGSRLLEQAYRELWASREEERGAGGLLAAERVRDLVHELRNPLGGVRGLAALLRREVDGVPAPERVLRLLERLDAGLAALESILQRHAGDGEDRADAACVAEETAGLAAAESRANGADVRFRVEAPAGIELPVPASPFREILANLVRNAAESCVDGGTVTVRIASSLDDVVVWVEDDGRGLPDVPDETLFRRGFSTKGPGRGRGLALIAAMVEELGGSLMLGRLERGTRARVRLPRS
jgi:signal transduction histidine kinase